MKVLADAVCPACVPPCVRLALLMGAAIAATLAPAATPPTAAGSVVRGRQGSFLVRTNASAAACSQLTKAQVQPLLVHRVTNLTVKPVPGVLYLSSAKQVGQTCTFADTETSAALTVVVIGGWSLRRRPARNRTAPIRNCTRTDCQRGKAVRQRADSHGAVSTAEVASINGSTYCAVIPNGETQARRDLSKRQGTAPPSAIKRTAISRLRTARCATASIAAAAPIRLRPSRHSRRSSPHTVAVASRYRSCRAPRLEPAPPIEERPAKSRGSSNLSVNSPLASARASGCQRRCSRARCWFGCW